MGKALTVIIPAYNVSQYIEQGMNSLLEDKSIIQALDIILVNDGSEDDTLEKVQKYCDLYSGIVRVIDKENGGHGSGINEGIKAAKGKYLKVIDGDDWVNTDGLRELVDYIRNSSVSPEVIINPFEKVWEDGRKEIVSFDNIVPREIVTFKEVHSNGYTLPLHTLTIKSDIYKKNSIPDIDERISYDDMEYILYPVPYINSIVFLNTVIYEYRLGLSGQSMNPKQMIRKLPMHIKVIESLAKYYRENTAIFNSDQRIYYNQEFVDTMSTNCEIRIRAKQKFKIINRFIRRYSDFEISVTRKKTLFIINKFGYVGYVLAKVHNIIRR